MLTEEITAIVAGKAVTQLRFFSTVRLPWLCTYRWIPQSPAEPKWPTNTACLGQTRFVSSRQRHTRGWLHLAWRLLSILNRLLSINQVSLHTAAVMPAPPWSTQSSSMDASCARGLDLLCCAWWPTSGGSNLSLLVRLALQQCLPSRISKPSTGVSTCQRSLRACWYRKGRIAIQPETNVILP